MPDTGGRDRLRVAVGVLRRADGAILLAQRMPGKHLAGLWEFPGGKREAGESRWAALVREIREEIGVLVEYGHPLIRIVHDYPERSVELDVWMITGWHGEPRSKEHQPLEWVASTALGEWPMPPADGPIIRAITLPPYYLITPEPNLAATEAFLSAWDESLACGIRLAQVRVKDAATAASGEFADLLSEIVARGKAVGARVLINAPEGLDSTPSLLEVADGVHLTTPQLIALCERPPAGLVAASCHGADELAKAEQTGLDFALLSPVMPTRSHPDAVPIGWDAFSRAVADCAMPIYGLGGLGPADLPQARENGAQGVAAIRGLWPGEVP